MLTLVVWFPRFSRRLVGALFIAALTACGSHNASVTPQNNGSPGIPIPQAIATALPNNGALAAYIRVDGGDRKQMAINNDIATIKLDGISTGLHTLTIEFEYTFTDKLGTPLMLASADKAINVAP